MSHWDTDFDLGPKTARELDHRAVEHGGIVAVVKNGYVVCKPQPPQHGWGFKWIKTEGSLYQGTLILVPRNDRTRAVARVGLLVTVTRLTWAPEAEVEAYVAAAEGVPYAREEAVIKAVFALKDSPAWEFFDPSAVKRWVEEWGLEVEFKGLSVPRILSVREIVKSL